MGKDNKSRKKNDQKRLLSISIIDRKDISRVIVIRKRKTNKSRPEELQWKHCVCLPRRWKVRTVSETVNTQYWLIIKLRNWCPEIWRIFGSSTVMRSAIWHINGNGLWVGKRRSTLGDGKQCSVNGKGTVIIKKLIKSRWYNGRIENVLFVSY